LFVLESWEWKLPVQGMDIIALFKMLCE